MIKLADLESDTLFNDLFRYLSLMTTNAKNRRVTRRRALVGPGAESAPSQTDNTDQVAAEDVTENDVSIPRNLAHPLRRLYAFAIDAGLWLAVVYLVAPISGGALFSPTAAVIDVFVFFAYFVLLTGIFGRTLGKWVAGIRVVDSDGNTPGVALAIPREMAGRFVAVVVVGVGLIWIVFDPKHQGWHDKMAGTYVVNDGAAGPSFLSRFFFPNESPDAASKKARPPRSKVGSRTTAGRRRKRKKRGQG